MRYLLTVLATSGMIAIAVAGCCGPKCGGCGPSCTCGTGCEGCGLSGCGIAGCNSVTCPQCPPDAHGPAANGRFAPDDVASFGPLTPTYGHPYYTTRAPRDFLIDNPATIGR